jgi:hypothetical protein
LIKKPENIEEFKQLADISGKDESTTERICTLLEDALAQHPEWETHLNKAI